MYDVLFTCLFMNEMHLYLIDIIIFCGLLGIKRCYSTLLTIAK